MFLLAVGGSARACWTERTKAPPSEEDGARVWRMEWLRGLLGRLHDRAYRCASCGALVEKRGGFCSKAHKDEWQETVAW